MHASTKRLYQAAKEGRQIETLSALAALLGESPQTVKNWDRRGVSKAGAIAAERAIGCLAGWILDGRGAMWKAPAIGEAPPPWMDLQHSHEGARSEGSMAQNMSYLPFHAPAITWETMVASQNLPAEFTLTLIDDALAPEHPRGTVFVWSVSRQPEYGSIVLVRDRHDQVVARRYSQGREPGRWRAVASHRDHADFDSIDDALTIVATARFRELP